MTDEEILQLERAIAKMATQIYCSERGDWNDISSEAAVERAVDIYRQVAERLATKGLEP